VNTQSPSAKISKSGVPVGDKLTKLGDRDA
jgi:hypothetical protein